MISSREYTDYGIAYNEENNFGHAIDCFTKAIQADTTNTTAYFGRGLSYCNLGEYKKALADFDMAIFLDPEDEISYCERGNVYQQIGMVMDAILDYTQVMIIDPLDEESKQHLEFLLSMNSSDSLLDAIDTLSEEKQKIMLNYCKDKKTLLGKHIFKNESGWRSNTYEKMMLKKILDKLSKIDADEVVITPNTLSISETNIISSKLPSTSETNITSPKLPSISETNIFTKKPANDVSYKAKLLHYDPVNDKLLRDEMEKYPGNCTLF